MISLVNSHTNATSKRWHLWEIDLRFALKSTPGWLYSASHANIAAKSWSLLERPRNKSSTLAFQRSCDSRQSSGVGDASRCAEPAERRKGKLTRGSSNVTGVSRRADRRETPLTLSFSIVGDGSLQVVRRTYRLALGSSIVGERLRWAAWRTCRLALGSSIVGERLRWAARGAGRRTLRSSIVSIAASWLARREATPSKVEARPQTDSRNEAVLTRSKQASTEGLGDCCPDLAVRSQRRRGVMSGSVWGVWKEGVGFSKIRDKFTKGNAP